MPYKPPRVLGPVVWWSPRTPGAFRHAFDAGPVTRHRSLCGRYRVNIGPHSATSPEAAAAPPCPDCLRRVPSR